MLDLSFLTEEEYEKLMKVLQRDAELKKKDGDRIRRLQGSLKDEKKKKFVTGEWFHEVKAQRFQQAPEGSELLRASIKKKSRLDAGENKVPAPEILAKGDASEGAALPSSPSERERVDESHGVPEILKTKIVNGNETKVSWEPAVDSAEEHRPSPKPRLRLAALPSLTDQRSSLEDISPADSGVGISPFLASRHDSREHGEGSPVSPGASAKLLERDLDDFSYSAGPDVPDAPNNPSENRAAQPALHEAVNPSSRIPVKKKASRGLPSHSAVHGHGGENPQLGPAKRDSPKTSRLPSSREEEEEGHSAKQGASYTISPVSNKEEEIVLDRQHFKNLKNFWEKGGESVSGSYGSPPPTGKGASAESNGKPSRLRRFLSAQSNQSQNSDDKPSPHVPPKSRALSRKPSTFSSSEEEPSYIAHPRKGSGPSIPRSTYARSKGGLVYRNSLSDENGKQPCSAEEEKRAQSGARKSKLPIRVPSVSIESPAQKQTGTLYEPETPADEFVMAEENQHKRDSLAGRVQILIETVPSEDLEKGGNEAEASCDLGVPGDVEGKELFLKEEPRPSAENLPGAGPEDDKGGIQDIGSSVPPERNGLHPSVVRKLTRTNGCSLAKSMVNLYTTTDTYTKPQMLPHHYLDPERAKDLSKSSPLLLSETESDTASEISFQLNRHKKSPSIGSHSSDMASVSSVSGSVLSVYSGDFGSVDAQGLVQFALDYDEKNREFQIFVSQCKDLAIVDEKKARTDPYVKTYLLPDKARMGKRKTSVKKRTVSPIYNEVLRYKIEKMVLLIQKLNLSVWHNDPLGRNSFLGEMEIDLAGWDWRNNKLNWYMLKPRSLSANNCVGHRGVMDLAIKYVPPGSLGWKTPPSGEVHIWVKDTKDLPQLRPSGVDSFVKCYVLPDTSKKSYQKTRIIKRDSNPVFNHTIVYDGFHTEDLKDACVELTVWDHEKLTNHFLGGIRLGLGTGSSYGIVVDWMDSTQEEVAFWQEMMATANEWVEGSLPLRSLAGKKKLK